MNKLAERQSNIISCNCKLGIKSCKGVFALLWAIWKFMKGVAQGFSFPNTNAGKICSDKCLGSWQCYSLETIKCWDRFSQPYDFCWLEAYKEGGQHQQKAWGCCRWPGPSGLPGDSNSVQQTVCDTQNKVHSISVSWTMLVLIGTLSHQKCP